MYRHTHSVVSWSTNSSRSFVNKMVRTCWRKHNKKHNAPTKSVRHFLDDWVYIINTYCMRCFFLQAMQVGFNVCKTSHMCCHRKLVVGPFLFPPPPPNPTCPISPPHLATVAKAASDLRWQQVTGSRCVATDVRGRNVSSCRSQPFSLSSVKTQTLGK